MRTKWTYPLILFILLFQFTNAQAKPVQVLSFDGGGVRGAVSIEFLKQLQQKTPFSPEHFDLYVGTSTGSILALCCAAGMELDQILSDYEDMSKGVFSHESWFSLFYSKFDPDILRAKLLGVLEKQGYSEKTLVRDLPKKVVITTVKLDDETCGRWKLEFIENVTEGGGNIPVIDALLDSTAAPLFFPSHQNHVDGGMGMNDPSLAGLTYALELTGHNLNDISLLSIGTGFVNHYIPGNEDWGLFDWLFKSPDPTASPDPLTVMIMDVEQQMTAQITKKMLGERFQKVDFVLQEAISLDDYKQIGRLIELTEEYVEQHSEEWAQICHWVDENLVH